MCVLFDRRDETLKQLIENIEKWQEIRGDFFDGKITEAGLEMAFNFLPVVTICDHEWHNTSNGIGGDKASRCPDWIRSELKDEPMTFYTFDSKRLKHPEMVDLVKGFPVSGKRILILHGNIRTGKTHLATALKWSLKKSSHSVIQMTGIEVFQLWYKMESLGMIERAQDEINKLKASEYIFIDDLGDEAEAKRPLVMTALKTLLDMPSLRFIITCNMSPDKLVEIYKDKIGARLMENMIALHIEKKEVI